MLGAGIITLLLAAGCSGNPDPANYFEAFDQSQTELDSAVGELFISPVALEVDAFIDEGTGALDPDQDALARQFVTEFWARALDAMAVHRDDLADFAVPKSIRSEHDAYLGAIEALLATRDAYLDEIATSSGADLLATFWDPDPGVEAVNDTCRAIVDEAADEGIIIASPICEK